MIGLAEPYVEAHGGFQVNSSLNKHSGEKQEVSEKLQTQNSDKISEKPRVTKPFPLKCHYCGQVGHKFANCKRRRNYEVNACLTGNENKVTKVNGSEEVLDCGHVTDVVSALINMPIDNGLLCGFDVKVLRDTGCSTVIARKSLVPAKCFTGQERMVKLANGQLQKYPVAEIEVESPYFNGKTTAVCMPNPSYDLMTGNIPGSTSLCHDKKCNCSQACAVTTRAGARRTPDQPVKPLRCLDLKRELQVTTGELRREQLCDPSLKKWREYALHGHPVGHTQNCRFQSKRGLLYRMLDCQDGKRRIYHANLLRRYIDRGENVDQVSIAVVEEDDQDEGLPRVKLPNLHQHEGASDVQVNPALTHDQRGDVQRVLLKTDASNTGLGAVLLQEVDGVKRPVAFASRKLIPREQKFSTIEKEALAIVWAVPRPIYTRRHWTLMASTIEGNIRFNAVVYKDDAGHQYLRNVVRNGKVYLRCIQQISDYWIRKVTPERLSVFNFTRGTNNDAESFHSRLRAIVRQHKPNIYTFLLHLNNLIPDAIKDIERLDADMDITRHKKEKFCRNIERRQNFKEKLQNGTYTLTQYINAVVYTFDSSASQFIFP
ncbi:hypothetical protein Pcinc_007378 [Petrolisthes cinctipes]|uniref:CCHC-type domain-containing protein n=1 Tax=Petrolisthes cinctipes TaxID=88211 RepID=A0AAE1KYA7_PETCI|nr:hypothetical protein Pcinc_007378 [Petrolisthes cinctipes]